ncbi:hypothetical protein OHB07_30375 [Streptomyces sp. NBC_00111]|uniref:hypothetical protein n=1 Tax=unclassified Streptomyces TaxID=2593676 RepID=UPI002E304FFF|nr:hypothetical protein [Streptomyces sp. NBC_01460]
MDPYDRHHQPGPARLPESSTPIYDRLLAEWRDAARSEPEWRPRGAEAASQTPGRAVSDRRGVFVPAARTAGGAESGGA